MNDIQTGGSPSNDQGGRLVNEPLLRKVLDHITAHPNEWYQGDWAQQTGCGTAYCVAGHAAVMTGHELRWTRWVDEDGGPRAISSVTTDGQPIRVVAADALGLGDDEARKMFAGYNSLLRIYSLASEYTDGAITVPDDLPGGS